MAGKREDHSDLADQAASANKSAKETFDNQPAQSANVVNEQDKKKAHTNMHEQFKEAKADAGKAVGSDGSEALGSK